MALGAITKRGSIAATSWIGSTQTFKLNSFGFDVPTGATIVGIQVKLTRSAAGGTLDEQIAKLTKGGTVTGADKHCLLPWSSSEATVTYGNRTDLWGATWTVADINSNTGFGLYLEITEHDPLVGATVNIADCQITVYYTAATATIKQQNHATTATNDTGSGSLEWDAPAYAYLSDSVPASCANSSGIYAESNLLKLTGFKFTVAGTVLGIDATVRRKGTSGTVDHTVKLLKAGTVAGSNKAGVAWSASGYVDAVYGGASDLWGTTWTAGDINDPDFGIVISADVPNGGVAEIDSVTLRVYTADDGQQSVTASASTVVNTEDGTHVAWVNASNAAAAGGGTATASLWSNGGDPWNTESYSAYLDFGGFGLEIPSNASIDGIEMSVVCKASAGNYLRLYVFPMFSRYGGYNIIWSYKIVSEPLDSVLSTYIIGDNYGGWYSYYSAGVSPSQFADSAFRVVVDAWQMAASGTIIAEVDYLEVTVYYTPVSGTGSGGVTSSTARAFCVGFIG